MAIPSRQIGWSQESNLLWQILKQLNRLTSIMFGLKPKYKVYTALLTQSGGDNPVNLTSGAVTKGVTYVIDGGSDGDFSNVGAPSNDDSTSFVAINDEVPNSYGTTILIYNEGAPTVTVLENTIGNIWFTYGGTGDYSINSLGLFIENKTGLLIAPQTQNSPDAYVFLFGRSIDYIIQLQVLNADESGPVDDILFNQMIEIRVYN
jgi:hypothetical protein